MLDNKNSSDSAIIKEVKNGKYLIEILRNGSCKSCGLNGVCAGESAPSITQWVDSPLKLETGTMVQVSIAPTTKLLSSFLIFIFPIILMIIFYAIAKFGFHLIENTSVLISLTSLLLSGFLIHLFDKTFGKKVKFIIEGKLDFGEKK